MSSAVLSFLPAPHAEQDALPLALVRPCGQLVHVTASEAAAKVLPAQDVHAVWPSRLLARPGTHEKHTVWPVFVWNLPVAQVWHALAGSLADLYRPATHASHGEPAAGEAVPATQAVQADPPTPA